MLSGTSTSVEMLVLAVFSFRLIPTIELLFTTAVSLEKMFPPNYIDERQHTCTEKWAVKVNLSLHFSTYRHT